MSPYSPLVIDHFNRPRNPGRLPDADDVIVASAGDAASGVRFELSAQIRAGRAMTVYVATYGCPHCIAAGSWLAEQLSGASPQDLANWRWRKAAEALSIPPEKFGRLLVLEDAVRALARRWDERRRDIHI